MARSIGSWAILRRLLDGWRPRRRRGRASVRQRGRAWQGRNPLGLLGSPESLEGRAFLSATSGDGNASGGDYAPREEASGLAAAAMNDFRPKFTNPLATVGVTRVSTDVASGQAIGDSWSSSDCAPVFSPDGLKIAFGSYASNLVPGDTNNAADSFVKDLVTGAITRVSTDAAGRQGNSDTWSSVFSPDGLKVGFTSGASNLVPDDTNSTYDIFVKDLVNGAITRMSTDAAGRQGNGFSSGPIFSPDGSKVAFESAASNLVPDDTNSTYDIFVKDLVTGAIARVSIDAAGRQGNDDTWSPVFSPDGSKMSFVSDASNLVPDDTNSTSDIFVKDLVTGAITRVSTDALGIAGNWGSYGPSFSPDGSKVGFMSNASNLVPDDTNSAPDAFVKDLVTGAITRVSTDAAGRQGNGGTWSLVFSPDSSKVAFESNASNLVPDATNATSDIFWKEDIFVKDLVTGAIARVSTDAAGRQGNGVSSDPVFSPDGSRVAFRSTSSNLVPGDTNDTSDIFVASLGFRFSVVEGTTAVATLEATGRNPGTTLSYSISGTDVAQFTIDQATSALAFTTPLRYDAPADSDADNVYDIRVSVTDGLFSTTVPARITVTRDPRAPVDILLSAATVAENQPWGSKVGTLSTVDPDVAKTFTYAFVSGAGSADNGLFTINNGVLYTTATFDFETQRGYSVRIRSTDQGGLFTEKTFTITVTDVVEVPGVPTGVVGTVYNGQVGISWAAPATNGGAPISDYVVQYNSDGGAGWTTFNDGVSAGTTVPVKNLANGTSYVFRVAAVNAVGTGEFSSPSAVLVPKPVPGPPAGVTGVAGVGQVSLSWTAPAIRGSSVIRDYRVQYSANGGATWTTFADATSAATTATVTGLANGVPYLFRVAAVNGSGMGLAAATSAPIMPRTTPGVATGLTGVAGNGRVTLSWTAPASNGGAAISDYRVQYSSDNGGSWSSFGDAVSSATSTTVAGLVNGKSYVFRVAAVNAAGAGAYGLKSAAVTPRTVPGVLTGIAGVPGNGSVTLSFGAPATNGGAAVTDYRVQYSSDNGVRWTLFADAVSSVTSTTVTGLVNGTTYVFRVAALNAAGAGGYSAKSAAVTPRTVPSAPTQLTTTAVPGKVTLAWRVPGSNGGAAIADYTVQYSSNNGTTWRTYADGVSSATAATVKGLVRGTSYVFRVAAVNAAGSGAFSAKTVAVTAL